MIRYRRGCFLIPNKFYCIVNGVEQQICLFDDVLNRRWKDHYNYKRVHDYTEAVIKIRLRLMMKNYAAYMESGVFDKKFNNQAAFYDSATPDEQGVFQHSFNGYETSDVE